jgi:hypothetical protein
MLHLEHRFVKFLKLGHFGKQIENALEDLQCGAGEGWRRSVGSIV